MPDDLFEAIEAHDAPRVGALLAAGADPDAVSTAPPHWKPLEAAIEAVYHGGPVQTMNEIVRLLVQHGADVNAWDDARHLTPLLAAVYWHNHEAARLLLAAGGDPGAINGADETALLMAVEDDDTEMARLLLAHGAAALIDRSGGVGGITPLGRAALNFSVSMIRLLLGEGARIDAADSDGRLPRDYLPARDAANGATWDEALELLSVGLPLGSGNAPDTQ